MTGVGNTLSLMIQQWAGGSLILALVLVAPILWAVGSVWGTRLDMPRPLTAAAAELFVDAVVGEGQAGHGGDERWGQEPINASIPRDTTNGLEFGARARYSEAFLMNSGVYVGLVDQFTVPHDQNAVGVPDGGKAMCDNDAGAVGHQFLQCILHQPFRFGIE